jgi:hypothetical protein
VVDNEHEAARNFTWAVLGMEDGNFRHLGGVTRWNSQFFNTYMNFSCQCCHHLCCFKVVPCLFWISLWLIIGVYNTLASKFCVKLLKPPNRFQRLALPFKFANTFIISLHALCTPMVPIPLYCHE